MHQILMECIIMRVFKEQVNRLYFICETQFKIQRRYTIIVEKLNVERSSNVFSLKRNVVFGRRESLLIAVVDWNGLHHDWQQILTDVICHLIVRQPTHSCVRNRISKRGCAAVCESNNAANVAHRLHGYIMRQIHSKLIRFSHVCGSFER